MHLYLIDSLYIFIIQHIRIRILFSILADNNFPFLDFSQNPKYFRNYLEIDEACVK